MEPAPVAAYLRHVVGKSRAQVAAHLHDFGLTEGRMNSEGGADKVEQSNGHALAPRSSHSSVVAPIMKRPSPRGTM